MKWIAFWVIVIWAMGAELVRAAPQVNDVVFSCGFANGSKLEVSRNPKTDMFTLRYGTDLSAPSEQVIKLGNNMGTSLHQSGPENSVGREVYFTVGEKFYTVGYVDKAGVISGYFLLTESTTELVYEDCTQGTVKSKFGDYELFKNLTEVD
jgi:hypothetical protein